MQNKIFKNVFWGFGGQIIVLILGIIIPRIMITSYGSDVNGLISTVTQIFTYMALLEAGIGQAARNALYKPLSEKDKDGVSFVASVSQSYFRRVTLYYGIGVVLLSVIAPFVLKSEVDKVTICLVILLQGMSGIVVFYYSQTKSVILGADGRGYINNGINVLTQSLSYAAKIILASLGVSIVILQIVYFIITVGKVTIYNMYFKRKYIWIDFTASTRNDKLKDRNAYIISELAWTLFSSTDMIILSVFVSTQLASVYSVYNLVFSNLHVLLNTVYSNVNYVLGQAYYDNIEKYKKLHDLYTSVFLGIMTTLMCVAYILILPFIKLYTTGVSDVEYIYSSLPVMFCLVQLLSWSRYISGNLTAVAGYAKKTSKISLIEALTNVILSVVLVPKYGIIGVLAATVIALPLKIIYCAYLSDKVILKRTTSKTLKILFANYLLFGICVWLNQYIELNIKNYLDFIKWGAVITCLCTLAGLIFNCIANRDCFYMVKKYLIVSREKES